MFRKNNTTYSKRGNHAARSAHRKADAMFRNYDTTAIRPKKSKLPVVFAALGAIALVVAMFWAIYNSFLSPASEECPLESGRVVQVEIAQGSTADDAAQLLLEEGVIASKSSLIDGLKDANALNSIHAGIFEFAGPINMGQVVEILSSPPNATLPSVTVVEGFTIAKTADKVQEATAGKVTAQDFVALANDAKSFESAYPFVAEAANNSLEGFLFPKTYTFNTDEVSADSLIRQMLNQYKIETANLDYSKAEAKGMTHYDVLKLASIIERETGDDARDEVSSVFWNRLDINMKLESDATKEYELSAPPTPEDLLADTPYNTYTNEGLTPTPICSPGLLSIQAALAPASTDFYYFYSYTKEDGTKLHYFSVTYEEHEQAIKDAEAGIEPKNPIS